MKVHFSTPIARFSMLLVIALLLTVLRMPHTEAATRSTGGKYLTIQFGRSQYGLSHRSGPIFCALDPRSSTLYDSAAFLQSVGKTASGTVAMGQMGTTDSSRGCPNPMQTTASWDDMATLRDTFGWTFTGDSQAIYDDQGNIVNARPNMQNLSPEEQYRQSCGSEQILRSRGFTRAWGMFAYPGNDVDDTAQLDTVSKCYSYSRKYRGAGTNNITQSTLVSPWYVPVLSVNGGHCTNTTAACYTEYQDHTGWNPNNRQYLDPQTLLSRIKPLAGQWKVVQFYRLVEGARLAGELPADRHFWDCTSPDPALHWTSQGEVYCANDFRWVMQNLPSDVQSVDAAYIADLWGRGNPNVTLPQ